MLVKNTPEYFWSLVAISNNPDACWIWQARKNKDAYGTIYWHKRSELAHRIAYLLAHGRNPGKYLVLHRCDNPSCCNPGHLFLGTILDNNKDRKAKNRDAHQVGESNGRAKLTVSQVAAIRALYAQGSVTYAALSAKFGVSTTQIRGIVKGWYWR